MASGFREERTEAEGGYDHHKQNWGEELLPRIRHCPRRDSDNSPIDDFDRPDEIR